HHNEAHAFFWWLMHATRRTRTVLQTIYRVDGNTHLKELELDGLDGYRRSGPVRVGNAAAEQLQLDIYGSVLDAIRLYACEGFPLDRDTAREVTQIADHVAEIWRRADSGIWEEREHTHHFTHSKALAWVALDSAAQLADAGTIPQGRTTGAARPPPSGASSTNAAGTASGRHSSERLTSANRTPTCSRSA